MERRKFLRLSTGVAGIGFLGITEPASALMNCSQFNFQGVQQCEAGIDSGIASAIAASVDGQHMDQWCWAACIEMVFRYYGLRIPQETIVQQTWGGLVNQPGQPHMILSNLNRQWRDSNGQDFFVSGDSYSANPVTAAQDLSQDMPLIIGTMGHAMVLTSLLYVRDQMGNGEVISAIVRDPWPGKGKRTLSAQEWYSTTFLARIRVTRI